MHLATGCTLEHIPLRTAQAAREALAATKAALEQSVTKHGANSAELAQALAARDAELAEVAEARRQVDTLAAELAGAKEAAEAALATVQADTARCGIAGGTAFAASTEWMMAMQNGAFCSTGHRV